MNFSDAFLKNLREDRFFLLLKKNNLLIEQFDSLQLSPKLQRIVNIFQIYVLERYIKKYIKNKLKNYDNFELAVVDLLQKGAGKILRDMVDDCGIKEITAIDLNNDNQINSFVEKLHKKILSINDPKIKKLLT